ncbi:MAG: TonB family protein [Acidobacteriia bacterium]|nr:TonB family protein [Terriglobia bacterium]
MEEQKRPAESQRRAVGPPVKITEADLHLLVADLQDDITTYRRREAAWLSLVVHGIVIALLLLGPKWTGNQPVIVPIKEKQQTTFLSLPDDQLKVKQPPKTDVISDKDRIAQTRTPAVDKEALRKLLDARKPGPPKASTPPPAGQQAMQENPTTTQGTAPVSEAQQQPPKVAQLETPVPAAPKKSPFAISSAGSSVNDAIHAVASGHGSPTVEFGGGEYGSAARPRVDAKGGLEILSDTMGVDFGPYMKRLRYTVQTHWDPLIPESAMPPIMRKGVVVIEFAITKDGKVMGMKLISSSGDVALDRAAWGAITDAIPLPNLPAVFAGDYLQIRARFYYNPDKNDLE